MKLSQEHVESNLPWLIVLVLLVVSVGGLVEIVPLFVQKSTTQTVAAGAGATAYDDMLARLRLKQAYGRLIRRGDDRGPVQFLSGNRASRSVDGRVQRRRRGCGRRRSGEHSLSSP